MAGDDLCDWHHIALSQPQSFRSLIMSQMFVLPSLELLLIAGRAVGLLLGLLIFAWAFRHWRRAATRDTQRVFEQLDLVRSELLIMKEVMHHAAHRADSVAHTVTHDTRLAAKSTNGAARGYEIAARMVRNGAAKDELIRSCGITDHEAELLIKLHGHRREGVAELVGRQPRVADASLATSNAASTRQAPTRQPTAGRQPTSVPRQNVAAAATQRSPERAVPPVRASSLPPRSRLVAVG